LWWIIGALIVNDLLIGFAFYQAWKYNFGLHVVQCDCGEYSLVTQDIRYLLECDSCHVCENCGRYLDCKTCGKSVLVRDEIVSVEFCNSLGCFEKYKENNAEIFNKENK